MTQRRRLSLTKQRSKSVGYKLSIVKDICSLSLLQRFHIKSLALAKILFRKTLYFFQSFQTYKLFTRIRTIKRKQNTTSQVLKRFANKYEYMPVILQKMNALHYWLECNIVTVHSLNLPEASFDILSLYIAHCEDGSSIKHSESYSSWRVAMPLKGNTLTLYSGSVLQSLTFERQYDQSKKLLISPFWRTTKRCSLLRPHRKKWAF